MPREQVRGANRQKRVASVTHSSRLLLPNPRNLPPTRHHPPPARRYPSLVTRFLAPLEAGSLDGPKNEAANVLQVRGVIAATSRPGRLSPSAHARDLRGESRDTSEPDRALDARTRRGPLVANENVRTSASGATTDWEEGGETRRPLSLPGKTPYPAPSLLRTRARHFAPRTRLARYPRTLAVAGARVASAAAVRAPPRPPNHRVPRTHERSR